MAYDKEVFNLTRLLQYAYRELGQLNVSTATGGTTTTIVDSKMVDIYGDDELKDGFAVIIEDAGGEGASPEGKYNRISGNTQSNGTITVESSLGNSVGAGDTYGYANNFYPHYDMIQLANDVLRDLGDMYLIDTTTLDSAASQTEYTYAIAWKHRKPFRVEIQGRVGDADDNKWYTLNRWEYRPATAGSTGLLVFDQQLPIGRDIAVHYLGRHPVVNSYEDPIIENVHPTLATKALVMKALEWQNRRLQGGDPFLIQSWNDARIEYDKARMMYQPWLPKRKPQLFTLGRYSEEDNFTVPASA